jgi:uncharacterized protein
VSRLGHSDLAPLPGPGLYVGTLRHRRFSPVSHAFRYPVFQALLDIDRIPEAMAVSRWTSYNRWNWAAFDERDHLGDSSRPLRERVRDDARRAGVELQDGPIFLLTNLRYLGYAFNPVSFFYCCTHAGAVQAVLAEVNNTFGGSHNYWLPSGGQGTSRTLRYGASKAFHVSPFMPMAMDYEFAFTRPGGRLVAHMSTLQDGRKVFDATLSLERRPWTPPEIRRALLRHPFMTGKVIAAIHYQALRLYLKRAPFYPNPHPAASAVSGGPETSTT